MRTNTRIILNADEGKVLTNGQIYGVTIYLGTNDSPDNWHEITKEEYQEIMAKEAQEYGFLPR